jgi:hypothetical protein
MRAASFRVDANALSKAGVERGAPASFSDETSQTPGRERMTKPKQTAALSGHRLPIEMALPSCLKCIGRCAVRGNHPIISST